MALLILKHAKLRAGLVLDRPMVIGRLSDCDLTLGAKGVSRRHARIAVEQGRWVIEDLGSTNHTLVNDRPITQARPLAAGDEIQIGTVRLIYLDAVKIPEGLASLNRHSRMTRDIIFHCCGCHHVLQAPHSATGQKGKCQKCGTRFFVPEASGGMAIPRRKDQQRPESASRNFGVDASAVSATFAADTPAASAPLADEVLQRAVDADFLDLSVDKPSAAMSHDALDGSLAVDDEIRRGTADDDGIVAAEEVLAEFDKLSVSPASAVPDNDADNASRMITVPPGGSLGIERRGVIQPLTAVPHEVMALDIEPHVCGEDDASAVDDAPSPVDLVRVGFDVLADGKDQPLDDDAIVDAEEGRIDWLQSDLSSAGEMRELSEHSGSAETTVMHDVERNVDQPERDLSHCRADVSIYYVHTTLDIGDGDDRYERTPPEHSASRFDTQQAGDFVHDTPTPMTVHDRDLPDIPDDIDHLIPYDDRALQDPGTVAGVNPEVGLRQPQVVDEIAVAPMAETILALLYGRHAQGEFTEDHYASPEPGLWSASLKCDSTAPSLSRGVETEESLVHERDWWESASVVIQEEPAAILTRGDLSKITAPSRSRRHQSTAPIGIKARWAQWQAQIQAAEAEAQSQSLAVASAVVAGDESTSVVIEPDTDRVADPGDEVPSRVEAEDRCRPDVGSPGELPGRDVAMIAPVATTQPASGTFAATPATDPVVEDDARSTVTPLISSTPSMAPIPTVPDANAVLSSPSGHTTVEESSGRVVNDLCGIVGIENDLDEQADFTTVSIVPSRDTATGAEASLVVQVHAASVSFDMVTVVDSPNCSRTSPVPALAEPTQEASHAIEILRIPDWREDVLRLGASDESVVVAGEEVKVFEAVTAVETLTETLSSQSMRFDDSPEIHNPRMDYVSESPRGDESADRIQESPWPYDVVDYCGDFARVDDQTEFLTAAGVIAPVFARDPSSMPTDICTPATENLAASETTHAAADPTAEFTPDAGADHDDEIEVEAVIDDDVLEDDDPTPLGPLMPHEPDDQILAADSPSQEGTFYEVLLAAHSRPVETVERTSTLIPLGGAPAGQVRPYQARDEDVSFTGPLEMVHPLVAVNVEEAIENFEPPVLDNSHMIEWLALDETEAASPADSDSAGERLAVPVEDAHLIDWLAESAAPAPAQARRDTDNMAIAPRLAEADETDLIDWLNLDEAAPEAGHPPAFSRADTGPSPTVPELAPDRLPVAKIVPVQRTGEVPSHKVQTCSICRDPLNNQKPTVKCPDCGQVYHAACWRHNHGCATHGCRQARAAKAPPSPLRRAAASPGAAMRAAALLTPVPIPDETPWELFVLTASLLACAFSLLLFGLPNVVVGLAAMAIRLRGGMRGSRIMFQCALTINVVGMIAGLVGSWLIYWK